MMLSITWGAVVKLCVVTGFAAIAKNVARCLHDNFCALCKKSDSCCK